MKKFHFKETRLAGAYVIEPFFSEDERGGFIKDYNIDVFRENGLDYELKEVFYTISKKGVIRANHFQLEKQQTKLVRCISGKIYDVITDLRPESDTFGQWEGFYLSADNPVSLFIPEYFAHGYLVLEDSIVSYKCGEVFFAEGDSGIKWDDSELNILWPVNEVGGEGNLIISDKDKNLMSFNQYKEMIHA